MSNLDVLNLNGVYAVNPKSESLEEVMKLQGMGWATRKLGAKVANTMILTIEHTPEKMVQTYSAAVKTKVVQVDLTANEKEVVDPDLNAKVIMTVTFEDDGKKMVIKTVCPKKFERVVTWERVDDNNVHSVINYALLDGSKQQVKVNRYYTKHQA
mmetsp:Transcript_5843/g.9636  ORF Transcript_5843/g.9636 Transcript_5843/m.9636 type:complete len:155 (+) Transcript_5843:34-498(+)